MNNGSKTGNSQPGPNRAEQSNTFNKCLTELLEAILEGGIRFDDKMNHDDLQKRIDKACERANAMQTPWFAHEYILDTCREDLESFARADAEDSLYAAQDVRIITGIV